MTTPMSERAGESSAMANERGIVLIVVLLVVTLLTITVVEFTFSTALDAHRARHARDALQANLLARSGINIAAGFLMLDDEPRFDWPGEEWWLALNEACSQQLQLAPNMLVRCKIRDESGKINVNLTRGRKRVQEGKAITPDVVLREAIRCLFQSRGIALEGEDIGDRLNEYWEQDPIVREDGREQLIPDFNSLEDFAAQFAITGDELRDLRDVLTAQPRSILSRINVNTADAEVLGAIITDPDAGGTCVAQDDAVQQIIDRVADEPFQSPGEINALLPQNSMRGPIQQVLSVTSNLFRLQASAVVNFDPENPGDFGGVAETLSVVVRRRRDPKRAIPDQNIPGWTLRAVDWQKEGGARLLQGGDEDEEGGEGDDEGKEFLPALER
jgi:type II secretory pathway component PulK